MTVVVPIRLVNQLESGTSSIVLMFWARVPDGLIARDDEQVVDLLVQLLDRIGLRFRRVLRLRFAGNRIVVIEARRLGRDDAGEQAERGGDQNEKPDACARDACRE